MKVKPTYEELEKRIQELEKIESEHKYSKEALLESESLFKMLYEKAPLGYQSLDENGRFIVVNQTWLDTLGYNREEVLGKSFADFLHPDWRDHFMENFPRFKSTGEILGVEFEMVKKNGNLILVSFTGRISRDKTGNFQQTHCIFHDITERKQAEDALQKSLNRLEAVQAALNDAIFLIDHGTRKIIECNSATVKIFGYNYEEILGKDSLLLHVDQEHFEKFGREATAAYADPGYYETEFEMRRKDGSVFPTENFVRPVRDSNGQFEYVVSVVRDITDRKKLRNQLNQAQKMESVGRLAGGVAHDFNNMLGVILGHTEMALEETDPASPLHADLQDVQQAAERSAALTRQLLAFARKQTIAPGSWI